MKRLGVFLLSVFCAETFFLFSVQTSPFFVHFRPQRPRSFWSATRIATSGKVQFSEHAQGNRFVLSANQICQTWLWACADWREVRESRTSGVGPYQRSRFLVLTKRGRECFLRESTCHKKWKHVAQRSVLLNPFLGVRRIFFWHQQRSLPRFLKPRRNHKLVGKNGICYKEVKIFVHP